MKMLFSRASFGGIQWWLSLIEVTFYKTSSLIWNIQLDEL